MSDEITDKVNRDVFRVILSKFLNREISARHVELLLQRLHWKLGRNAFQNRLSLPHSPR